MSKSIVKFKPITIQQAEKEATSSVYALNRIKEQSNININITLIGGEKTLVTIPTSPCPMDLTVYAPKAELLASPVFRRLVAAGHISLIDSAQAADFIMNDPRGIRETKRIFKDTAMNNADMSSGLVESEFNSRERKGTEETMLKEANIFVETILVRAQDPNEVIDDLISELDSRINSLTEEDLKHIVDQCTQPAIKEWAIEALGE